MITTGKLGDQILITGSGIYDISAVIFTNEVSGRFIENNDSLLVQVPLLCAWGPIRIESESRGISGYSTFYFVPEPKITGFYPTTGIPGTVVTVRGYAFSGVTGVSFNNLNATSITVNSNSGLSATLPTGNTQGFIKVWGQSGLTNTSIKEFFPTALITGLSSYSMRTGDALTISGINFLPSIMLANSSQTNYYYVSFNGATGSFDLVSSIKLTGFVPADATTGPINILRTSTDYHPSNYSGVILPSKPVISEITPASGKIGTDIKIRGSNFYYVSNLAIVQTLTTVNITTGDFVASSMGNVIYFKIPTGLLEGKSNVVITASGGLTTGISGLHVLDVPRITGFDPSYVKANDILRISGLNLYPNSLVYLSNVYTTPLKIYTGSDDNRTLDVIIPGSAYSENDIIVDNLVGISEPSGTLYYYTKPGISGFYPLSGSWGNLINISGTGFAFASGVFIGNQSATFTTVGTTGLTFIIPTGSRDSYIKIKNPYTETYSSTVLNIIDPVMSVTGFDPINVFPGNLLTISGTYFYSATGIIFSGKSGLFPINDFVINSGGDIIVEVPKMALSQKVGVRNETAISYSSNILNVIRPPLITGISFSSGVYNSLLTISGSNFTGTEFYFKKYDDSYVKGSGTVNTSSILATTFIPKGIVTNRIAMSGLSGFYTSSFNFTPLPTIEGFDPQITGSNIGDRIRITGVNAYETIGILMSGSGIYRNIISTYSDLGFDNNAIADKSIITGYINGNFYGTGYLYLIPSTWTEWSGGLIPNSGMRSSSTLNITGGIPTISGFYPLTGDPYTTFYVTGSNLRRAKSIIISGYYLGYSEQGVITNFDYINDRLISGKIGQIMDVTFKDAEVKLNTFSNTHISINNPTYPETKFTKLNTAIFSYTFPGIQSSLIYTGTQVLVSGMYFQSIYTGYIRDGFGFLRMADVSAYNTSYGLQQTFAEALYFTIPSDQSLTDQNIDLLMVNAAGATGIISGVKISNFQDVANYNDLETKIYIFS